jgi:hypothetical protein
MGRKGAETSGDVSEIEEIRNFVVIECHHNKVLTN